MRKEYYDGKYNVGEKMLYLIWELNKNEVDKEKLLLILEWWAKDSLDNIRKEHNRGRITNQQFTQAKEDLKMVTLEALCFIDKKTI